MKDGNGRPGRWPLLAIAAPAAVAIWSGWVGPGELCGFGVIHPLPGIIPALQINTAVTLPVGVEAYAAFALGAWMAPGTPERARRFAKRSAVGALVYGMAGQVIFHLLTAAGARSAPWPVVVVVSCMPVAVLGLAAALTHLLRAGIEAAANFLTPGKRIQPVPSDAETAARAALAATVAAGNGLSQNQLMTRFRLTRAQATKVRRSVLTDAPVAASDPPTPRPATGALNGQKQ